MDLEKSKPKYLKKRIIIPVVAAVLLCSIGVVHINTHKIKYQTQKLEKYTLLFK